MKKTAFLVLLTIFIGAGFAQNNGNTSIAMLNELATKTRVITSSKNNRLVLDEIYNELINNTNPSIVDVTTQDFLQTMLDAIESFRITSLQRERLEYLFENEQSRAFTQAFPNPLILLASRDINPMSLFATIAMMTVDSVFKYQGAKNNAHIEFMKGSWDLDDKESAILHELRSLTLGYMIDTARTYNLGMTDTLNEVSIDNFADYSFDDNLERRRQILESNRALYAKYAPYWILLIETYYDLELYDMCIDAANQYELVQSPIFRKDAAFARVLPKVITAVSHVHGTNFNYINLTRTYVEKLVANTTDKDWALRYFAAQAYIRMAGVSNRQANLLAAYDLLIGNLTYLSQKQEALLVSYFNPIDESIPQGISKEREKQLKHLIKELKNARKKELPPLHDGLSFNYQTVFALMNELAISPQERGRINAIVDKAFPNKIIRNVYFDEPHDSVIGLSSVDVSNSALFLDGIPVSFLFPEMNVRIKITEHDDGNELLIFEDDNVNCKINAISRGNSQNLENYTANVRLSYSSENTNSIKKAKDYFIYATFSYQNFEYTLRFNKTAGTGHFLGLFGIKPAIGRIVYE